VYNLGGIMLARTGALFVQPDNFWVTTLDFVRQFFHIASSGQPTRHYMPFYQWTLKDPTLEIGFLPLPKVWTALVVWLGGEAVSTWATPFWGLTSLAALYGLARRLFDWKTGLAAMVLLGTSLPQIWFAREPVSEIYAQALGLGGLYLAVLARRTAAPSARLLALWSGLTLAALTILRFEGAAIALAWAVLFLLGWYRAAPGQIDLMRVWGITLGVASGLGLAISVLIARHYFFTSTLLAVTPPLVAPILAGLVALILGGIWLGRHWNQPAERLRALLGPVAHYLPLAVGVGWLMWAVLAAWRLSSQAWGSSVAGWLALYWTLPGVILGIGGMGWLVWQARRADQPEVVTLAGLTAVFMLLFSVRLYVTPAHPWAIRRLVPIVMPTMAWGTAWLLTAGAARLLRLGSAPLRLLAPPILHLIAWGVRGLALAIFLLQVWGIGQIAFPFWFHREFAGLWAQLQTAVAKFPPRAVLLFDDGDVARGLAPTLELLFGHPALVLYQSPDPSRISEVDKLIEAALAQNRSVYLVITNGNLKWQPAHWQLVSQGATDITLPVLRHSEGRLPVGTDIVSRTLWLDVYQIKPGAPLATQPLSVTAGTGSYLYLRDGFYGWELGANNAIARWTDGDGQLTLPWPAPQADAPASFCLKLDVAGGRPLDVKLPKLMVKAEGREIFQYQFDGNYAPTSLHIPVKSLQNRGLPQLEVELVSDTWNAAAVGDARTLGVLFYAARLETVDKCSQ
jgi:hypothetical protein